MLTKEQTRRNIALAVKRLMAENALSQHTLAEASGIHQPRISLMLNQGILVNSCDIANLAEALGVSSDDLIHNRRLATA